MLVRDVLVPSVASDFMDFMEKPKTSPRPAPIGSEKPVRILIADDHDVVRMGVRLLLESQPGWVVCGEARTGREAVAKALELRPDLIVLDVSMPELNGVEVTRQIRKTLPASILIVTMYDSERMARAAIEAGASGYLSKADAGQVLIDAVHAVLGHGTFVSDCVHLAEDFAPSVSNAIRSEPLTPREREVLQLLAEGQSNKEVAAALDISPKTVETHRARIFAKLHLHSMNELVRYAIRNQVIEP
jgi:DNA-binding NarL/FixJ family response regulator